MEKKMDKKERDIKITHLQCREIQAPIISSLIKAFVNKIGYDNTMEIVKQVVREDAILSGRTLADKYGGNTLKELSKIVNEVWANDEALKIKMMKEDEGELFFEVTSCKYSDMYEKLGIKELGCVLSCSRDFFFMEGFNPEIELIRTKTIMGGSEYCDFRYVRKA
jgi:hypothetical protein